MPDTTTSIPDRLRALQVNAALAVMAGDDMGTLDAAATLESAADLLGDAVAVCRWVVVLAEGGDPAFSAGLAEMARAVVRRADEGERR